MKSRPSFADVLAFNIAVLEQGLLLTRHYAERPQAFAAQVGPHLRHIIEHYEALLDRAPGALVDYDHRARDRGVERSPALARQRLEAAIDKLRRLEGRAPSEPLSVGFTIGLDGTEFCVSPSTLVRELNFVASHAIHHYAILRPLADAAGLALPPAFGKAPETVRHERLQWAT